MNEYPAGSLKRHPDWPANPTLAMRSAYDDGQYPGWTSWIKISPDRTEFVTPGELTGWIDVSITDQP